MLLKLVELLLKFVRFAMWPLRPEDETRLTGGSRGEFMFMFSAIIKDKENFKSKWKPSILPFLDEKAKISKYFTFCQWRLSCCKQRFLRSWRQDKISRRVVGRAVGQLIQS